MNEHLKILTKSVDQLREGCVQTKQGRSACLEALKGSIEGRHKFWATAVQQHGSIASYVDEVHIGFP